MTDSKHDEHLRILIVEDSRAIASELQRKLSSNIDFAVDVVSAYADAHEYVSQNARDIFLAILDLNLADASGSEVVDLFRSLAVPSIVFTADFAEETREQMRKRAVIDYFVKDSHAVANILEFVQRLVENRRTTVLVVEDSESSRLKICGLLYRRMYNVVDVADAESALNVLNSRDDIDVVIIDFQLPGMNGIELTKIVRKRNSKDGMAVVGISGVDRPLLSAEFIKTGANDFLSKPFEDEEFNCRVDHVIDMQRRIRALNEANAVKNRFLGMVVHDLRSPINGINGLSKMLIAGDCGPLNEEQLELVEFIYEANLKMNTQVGDLLDISVIESGRLRLALQPCDLGELVGKLLRIHNFGARKKGIGFETDIKPVAPFSFDRRRVGQAFENLMTNAIKFSPIGGVITVSLKAVDNEAVVSIKDQGEGIPPGETDRLFRSFERTSVQPTAGESSTGLGLPIVKKIIESHGGRVWVESEFQHGATFYFSLPLDGVA